MPELLAEMRKDLAERPLGREFVISRRSQRYWACGHELVYYLDDHAELMNKLRILENAGMVSNITYNNVDRYVLSEELVEYLTSTPPPNQGTHPTAQKPGGG
jgi:predicted nicotinamide N-methyase